MIDGTVDNINNSVSISLATTESCLNLTAEERDPAKGKEQAYINLTMQLDPYQPVNIVFPRSSGRTFRKEWYKSYEWLEYSQELDAAFCFYCRAFPTIGMETAFISCGFKKWGKATQRFSIHQKSNSHKEALCKVVGYKQSLSSYGNIIGLIDKNHSKVVSDNRNYLKNILETLLYCAKQGIAIRGHDENFKSLNKEILSAGIFNILIDETQDLSRHEQVSVFIRYVHNLEPKEVFLGFYRTNSTDGESLVDLIKEVLKLNALKIENIRGQCYDGAASMRGAYKGVQARIRKENSLAVDVHCYAHILNLCLVDLAKQKACVRNMTPKTLKTLCETRWSCHYEALRSVFHNLTAVIDTLAEIAESDREFGSDAAALLKSIQTFEFIFSLILLEDVLLKTNVLSKYLQSTTFNYGLVSQMVKETIKSFEELRTDENFQKVWDKAAIFSQKIMVLVSLIYHE
ncbi:zinc finger MYM-type protein 1-like [Myzus persicae]|uniref:zinc finger MYM-type protein 1-like n=1 Tax=Myzus persicae TaxID=13164 RepID=UPI000B932218|nr:zinc finger MYM-type protein 1-like [Myzus persicae]